MTDLKQTTIEVHVSFPILLEAMENIVRQIITDSGGKTFCNYDCERLQDIVDQIDFAMNMEGVNPDDEK